MSKTKTGGITPFMRSWRTGYKIIVTRFLMLALALTGPGLAHAQSISPDTGPGPVRLARVSYVSGAVSFRTTEQGEWSSAVRNLPLRQGAELTASDSGRTEVQFDDGSRLRLGDGAIATITVMYSDSKGEYTQISLRSGEASLRLLKAPSVYEVDTPTASVDVSGPARLWIDARSGLRTSVLQGSAVVQGKGGKVIVANRYSLTLRTVSDAYVTEPLSAPDTFDKWCVKLDETEDHDLRDSHRAYEPANVAIMSDNLDNYGYWRTVATYGRVWHPYHCYAGWRPYHDGHWVWEDTFGWTWVGAEPWGWAPYHYGTWVDESFGWCWDPGPRVQYWSPAVVDFYCAGANIAWCPLAPSECVYPAGISIGFGGPNWWLTFGIGGACAFYPGPDGICRPYAWDPRFVNRQGFVGGVGGWAGVNHNALLTGRSYIPINARGAAGASLASASAFGGRGAYRSLPSGSRSAFTGGHFVGAPASGASPAGGPASVRPTALSASATRSLKADPPASVSRAALNRSVNRTATAAQSPAVAREAVAQSRTAASAGTTRAAGSARTATAAGSARASSSAARATTNTANRTAARRTAATAARTAGVDRARTAANNARASLGMQRTGAAQSHTAASRTAASGANRRTASAARTGTSGTARRTASAARTGSGSTGHRSASERVATRSRSTAVASSRSSFGGSNSGSRSASITRSHTTRSSFGGRGNRSIGSGGRSIGGGGSIFGGGGHSFGGGGHSPGGGRGGGRENNRR